MQPDATSAPIIFPYDLYHFWAAGRVANQGGNPYDRVVLLEKMLTAGWPATEDFHGFLHPPWTIWLFGLLGKLSFEAAVLTWFATSGLAVALSFYVCTHWLNWTSERAKGSSNLPLLCLNRTSCFLAFIFFTFPPLLSTFWNGQTNILIFLGLALFLSLERKKFDLVGGIALSLVLIKPQLFIGFLLAIAIFVVRLRRFRMLAGIAVGLLVQVGASLIVAPRIFEYFIIALSNMTTSAVVLPGASLGQTIYQFLPFQIIFPIVTVGFTALASTLAM